MVNQFRPVTMKARTTPGYHNPRISAKTVTNRLREIDEIPSYTMYVLYAAFLFWPSIYYAFIPLLTVKLVSHHVKKKVKTVQDIVHGKILLVFVVLLFFCLEKLYNKTIDDY